MNNSYSCVAIQISMKVELFNALIKNFASRFVCDGNQVIPGICSCEKPKTGKHVIFGKVVIDTARTPDVSCLCVMAAVVGDRVTILVLWATISKCRAGKRIDVMRTLGYCKRIRPVFQRNQCKTEINRGGTNMLYGIAVGSILIGVVIFSALGVFIDHIGDAVIAGIDARRSDMN